MAGQKYHEFTPITYAEIVKNNITTNYKVIFNVGKTEDEEHLIVVVDVSPDLKGHVKPRVESIITPDGILHESDEIHNGGHDHHKDHGKKW